MLRAQSHVLGRLPHWAVIRDARRRQRRRLRRRALVLSAALAAAGAGLLAQRSDPAPSNPYATAAARLKSVEFEGFGGYVLAAQAADDRIWVMTCASLCGAGDTGLDTEQLVELDARSGSVIRHLPPMGNVMAFTTAGRSIWVAHGLNGEVARINPATGRITVRLHLRLPVPVARHDRQFLPKNLSYARGYVWASSARGWLAQIDARTGRLVRMLRTPSEDNATTTNRYGTWVAENLGGIGLLAPGATRLRIHTIMEASLPLDVSAVYDGGRVVWALAAPDTLNTQISGRAETIVVLIDPPSDHVIHRVHVPVPAGTVAVAAGGALYLGDLAHGRIYCVGRDGALRTFDTPRHVAWLAASSSRALWAAGSVTPSHRSGWLLRIRLPRG